MVEEDSTFHRLLSLLRTMKRLGLYEWMYPDERGASAAITNIFMIDAAVKRIREHS